MSEGFIIRRGGGGGLNFKIVGGTEQPTNPKENTIWVNTDQPITEWVFSNDEPENPMAGMVWISIGTKSSVTFNALRDGEIYISPNFVNQYVDGEWSPKDAKTYLDGEWKSWVFYLYQKDAGLERNFVSVMAVTISDNSIIGNGYSAVRTTEMIDFDNLSYETIVARVRMGSEVYDYPLNLVVTDGTAEMHYNPSGPANPPQDAVAYSKIRPPVANAENTIELNVKNISGKHYVGLGLGYHNGSEVLEIRFE